MHDLVVMIDAFYDDCLASLPQAVRSRQPNSGELSKMLKKLQHWLRHSAHVHVRSGNVANMHDLVVMIDAFLDDKLAYDLQWDDFISWKHENPNIEAIRKRIAATEPLFFSDSPGDRKKAVALLIAERNRAAALVGGTLRS